MKQCISRIIQWIIHLWRTLQKYVHISRRVNKSHLHVEIDLLDTSNQSLVDLSDQSVSVQTQESQISDKNIIIEEESNNDAESNCLLESTRDEES